MMSTLYVTVPTDPMAESIHEVTERVDTTTVAIVAMKVATVAAEQAAADHICENVNRGFHSLILSQISQKCAKAKSTVDAKIQELNHFGSALRRIHGQMDRDFHRISDRYHKVFQSLNNSLQMRIHELDKAATQLATVQMPRAMQRMLGGGVQTTVHQRESLCAAQSIASSLARRTAWRTISYMCDMLQKTATLQSSMTRITDDNPAESSMRIFIPVVLLETDDLNLSISTRGVHIPDFLNSENIETAILQNFNAFGWNTGENNSARIKEYTRSLFSKARVSDRVRAKAIELLENGRWLQTKAGGV
jgi:hypothetical protein